MTRSIEVRLAKLERRLLVRDPSGAVRPGPLPGFWVDLAQLLRESPYLDLVLDETLHVPPDISAEEFLAALEDER